MKGGLWYFYDVGVWRLRDYPNCVIDGDGGFVKAALNTLMRLNGLNDLNSN